MLKTEDRYCGSNELRSALMKNRKLFWAVGLFSFFANLLMLTGPIYMLQVYDRVLGSGSVETLIALSAIMVFMYVIMGVLDYVRGRIMARVGARFQSDLDQRVFIAAASRHAVSSELKPSSGLLDLESIQRLITSPVLIAAFDIPWTPIFFLGIYLFHPWLGYLAIFGACLLLFITLANQVFSQSPQSRAREASLSANAMSTQVQMEAEIVQAMGMQEAIADRWNRARGLALSNQTHAADVSGSFTATSKTLRMLLQSAMLGLGAWLVMQNSMTAGGMIASSILLGRALAPVDLALNQWPVVQQGIQGWSSLAELLVSNPRNPQYLALPKPKANLIVSDVDITPPGEAVATVCSLNFEVRAGQALAVVGPSGCGKSTLARALTGVWLPNTGTIRLDGAALDQYGSAALGKQIGYLPQRVQFFDGTIAENIAGFDPNSTDEKVISAAKKAAAHEVILGLPKGYNTPVFSCKMQLSGGQIQRIGLARALYGNPVLIVLDEPNSNLDSLGTSALNQAIQHLKRSNCAVVIMAHRPAAIQQCDLVLVLEKGFQVAFGSKGELMAERTDQQSKIPENLSKTRSYVWKRINRGPQKDTSSRVL